MNKDKKQKNNNNFENEVRQKIIDIFEEFKAIGSQGIQELKMVELKISILKEILKINLEIDKKHEKSNENQKNKQQDFIKIGLMDTINDLIHDSLYPDKEDKNKSL